NGNNNSSKGAAFGSRRSAKNPAFETKLQQMALPLAPLVQMTTGAVHPAFPPTLLSFWLLTDDQLDALASFYHQRTPCQWTAHYPCPVTWPQGLSLEEKRRKLGKFIGLRGCDTPLLQQTLPVGSGSNKRKRAGPKTEEEIEDEARRARGASDDEMFRRKM
ncbi:hypothetical protein B0T26DRAFT_615667, partial [Lasiosphaeria miniovina]